MVLALGFYELAWLLIMITHGFYELGFCAMLSVLVGYALGCVYSAAFNSAHLTPIVHSSYETLVLVPWHQLCWLPLRLEIFLCLFPLWF